MEGVAHISILFNSSAILSFDKISILGAILRMDSMDSGTMLNVCSGVLSFVAKRTARSILRGSSE